MRYIYAMLLTASIASADRFPLAVSSSGRYIVDGYGNPFFLNAECAWSLLAEPTVADAREYLNDRKSKGVVAFTAQCPSVFVTNQNPYRNCNGVNPWTGLPFLGQNNAYFAHADTVIAIAESLGQLVMIWPAYLGYNCTNEGWCADVNARTAAEMKTYGAYVGNFFKNRKNIVWGLAGDTDPVNQLEKLDSMVSGIRSTDTIYARLFTSHNNRPSQAISTWGRKSWLNLNNYYTNWNTTMVDPEAWDTYNILAPALPFFLIEGWFENEHSITVPALRAQAYWTVLSGGCGHLFGNTPLWALGFNYSGRDDWRTELNSPGSISMSWANKLFLSRSWWILIPDTTNAVMTAGHSSGTDIATTAYASDSSSIIAYVPTQRSVTINPARLKGDSIHVYWFNPSNGAVTDIGIFSKASRSYNQPSAGDWVMVIDAKGLNFNQPGNLAPRLVSPANSSTGQLLNPFLVWNASEGAESYSVHVALDPGFGSTVLLDTLVVDTTRQVVGLTNATTYYWRVRSRNSLGQSPWSLVWSFTVGSPRTTQILHVVDGWNLISVPLSVADGRTITLFPTATSQSFSYVPERGYQPQDTLLNGAGYWLKFGDAQNVSVTGLPRTQDTISVGPGWNIIGSISFPVDTSTIQSIPPGIRISEFYGYASGYTAAASIDPGKGYWVKTNAAGRLILSSGGPAQPASRKSSGTKPFHKR